MAKRVIFEPSRALAEFRLLPGLTMPESTTGTISLQTHLVRSPRGGCIDLKIPLVAAAMQSVSGVEMGIALAREGGVAFLYSSQAIEQQASMVKKVKQYKAGFVKPLTVPPTTRISDLARLIRERGFSTFPVVDERGVLLGLITKNDFAEFAHRELEVSQRMIPVSQLVVGVNVTSLRQANEILVDSHQGVLPIVDGESRLRHLVFRKDIDDHLKHPNELVDERKRLLAAAAINTHDFSDRVPALVEAGVDLVAIDSSDGHSFYQKACMDWLSARHPDLPVIAGNIVTSEGFRYLAEAGAGAIKIGMGGGSICITQEQKGTGRGLGTAILEVAGERDRYYQETGRYLPLIADGGIVHAKDMSMALALGADSVMLGRYFARMDESPTEKVVINSRVMKPYWGEGSARAQQWRSERYGQTLFAEGVEGYVEYAGPLHGNLPETLAKIRSTMSSCGAGTIEELHRRAEVEVVSSLSIREGQVHDIFLPPTDQSYFSKSWGQ